MLFMLKICRRCRAFSWYCLYYKDELTHGFEYPEDKLAIVSDNEAQDLVDLYAQRQSARGYQYSADTVWQNEFEEAFPYEETDDQLNAIADCKRDMESGKGNG